MGKFFISEKNIEWRRRGKREARMFHMFLQSFFMSPLVNVRWIGSFSGTNGFLVRGLLYSIDYYPSLIWLLLRFYLNGKGGPFGLPSFFFEREDLGGVQIH
jgi:hypothetical protein